jgi:hypothetical protein
MGTRSLTIFNNEWDNEEIVVLYRQYDGYPTGHGRDLLSFLNNMNMVNGISNNEKRKIANGMGCLSAQIVAYLKEAPGDFYLHSAGTRDIGEEFIYTLYYTEELKIKVQDTYDGEDNVIFDGNTKEYKDWINLELNPKNQNKKKEDECFFI